MKMLMSLDLYLWNHFIPKINADFFKRKFNSILAMLYISLFKLPRKFLINYFFGKGKSIVVDTQELIIQNSEVLSKLTDSVQFSLKEGLVNGSLTVSQTEVDIPNYKYSIGSFSLNYSLKRELITINIHSNYHFQELPNRITKYLHNWLFTLKEKGKTNDFEITGNDWIITMNELFTLETEKQSRKELKLKLLV